MLVPGFAGFDALGQLEYYSDITLLCGDWLKRNEVLHYFDNLPTAAVVTRAARLRSYLAKRMARGEISGGDEVALVGHSTGGLDIRCLLWDLHSRKRPIRVDGGVRVDPIEIRERVHRVVFLSVPHWGTNIADWVKAHWPERIALVDELRAAVAGSQLSVVDRIESAIAESGASLTGAELFLAVQDALDEANELNGKPSPMRTADAQEAASQLSLYLRLMASDFAAIDDLTSCPPQGGKSASPAHFDVRHRKQELEALGDIKFQSYVTIGRRVVRFDPGKPAPPLELAKPWTYPRMCEDGASTAGTDIVYRTCYRACAGGPFGQPVMFREVSRWLKEHRIELWDNDGIVNTMSMPWPTGENVLIHADHMDIVGHYRLLHAEPGGGRTYRTYDLLKSNSGFSRNIFDKVWNKIFGFCLGRTI